MAEVSRALALGSKFDFKDKTYDVSPWTYGIQGEFEKYLEHSARKEAVAFQGILNNDAVFAKLLKEVHGEISSGVFRFGGQKFAEAIQSPAHIPYLFLLCLKVKHKEVTMELVQEMCKENMQGIVDAMAQANEDPNENGVATTDQVVAP